MADSSIFSLDSVLREIYIYTVDLLKVNVYNLELQATNIISSQIDSSYFTITIEDPCNYVTITPSALSSPVTYYIYDSASTLVFNF